MLMLAAEQKMPVACCGSPRRRFGMLEDAGLRPGYKLSSIPTPWVDNRAGRAVPALPLSSIPKSAPW